MWGCSPWNNSLLSSGGSPDMAGKNPKGVTPDELKPYLWTKGQSGNPKGRSKKKSFEELVEDLLAEATVHIGELDIGAREAVAGRLINMLLVGNEKAIVAYLDRVWPKVARLEVELPGLGPSALEAAMARFKPNGTDGVSEDPWDGSAT